MTTEEMINLNINRESNHESDFRWAAVQNPSLILKELGYDTSRLISLLDILAIREHGKSAIDVAAAKYAKRKRGN